MKFKGIIIFDLQFIFLLIDNKVVKDYIKVMQLVVIYVKINRYYMSNFIILVLEKYLIDVWILYDVVYNIVYMERFVNREKFVIRKGVIRVFLLNYYLILNFKFVDIGYFVILLGSMGLSLYLMRGIEDNVISYYIVNYGVGRVLLCIKVKKIIFIEEFLKVLKQGQDGEIFINIKNFKDFLDESLQSYKDIEVVINLVIILWLVFFVVKMELFGVIKGKD